MQRKFLRENGKAGLAALVILFVASFFVVTLGSGRAKAYVRPANPVMDYVPQDIGIYDTYCDNLEANDCRGCHGDRNAEAQRHQYTASAFAGCPDGCPLSPPDCLSACHNDPNNPQTITNDCIVCHPKTGLPDPHHESDPAHAGQCTACHETNLLVETRSVRTPFYYPTVYTDTPTPYSCENCHWPSGDVPHTPPSDWPMPIEANGPLMSPNIVLHPSKPYRPSDGTHHNVTWGVYTKCYDCHGNNPDNLNLDDTNPLLIRYCENCHSIDALHSIEAHTTAGHNLTADEKCIACHGDVPGS